VSIPPSKNPHTPAIAGKKICQPGSPADGKRIHPRTPDFKSGFERGMKPPRKMRPDEPGPFQLGKIPLVFAPNSG